MKNAHIMERPTHRAIIDRRTGQMVGPPVPIHPEDWPYGELHPSEQLWKYMDSWKFEDLCRSSALYFSRPDKFTDPFEGRFSWANSTKMSASDGAFHATYRIAPTGKELEASQEIMRQCVFISCWQRSKAESWEMWKAYTSGSESVAINTSAKALYTFVPEQIIKSPVKYHADDFPRTEFSHTAMFFYKPKDYRFEREFRLMLVPGEQESISLDEVGRRVPVKLKKIVHRVITHPAASAAFKATVDSVIRQSLKHLRREDSNLLL
jgi:hypothetical protein